MTARITPITTKSTLTDDEKRGLAICTICADPILPVDRLCGCCQMVAEDDAKSEGATELRALIEDHRRGLITTSELYDRAGLNYLSVVGL